MNNEIRWFARLGIDQGLFSRRHCLSLQASLGDKADLMDFAQRLIDDGIVEKVEALEEIAALSVSKSPAGPPSNNPFAETPEPAASANSSKLTSPATTVSSPTPAPKSASVSPQIDLVALAALTDEALAKATGDLLRQCADFGASDLHLSAGSKPFLRKHRALVPLADSPLSPELSLRLNTALLAPHQRQIYQERRDFDYALAVSASDRYRVNLMVHKGGAAGAYRMVPAKIPRLEDLGFRNLETIRKMLTYHNGLVLVTGPVGAGKTTTLATLVAELNEQREDHIITVEDPIEVVQPPRGCNVTQREVGPHTRTFATALKGALREDPDVIVIGELRDLETIEMAITAAETGHLVIGTMHTSDASTTLNRLLDVFPAAQQAQVRASLAESLRGVVCQRLLPSPNGQLVLACEILVANTAVGNLIRDGKTQGLRNVMETGIKEGMCLMESVVFELYQARKISADTALANITNRVIRAKVSA